MNVKERYSKYAIKNWKQCGVKSMIGDNVQKFRKKKGLTQDRLARKADIPYTTLTKLESNVVKKPSVQTVAKIANALGVRIEDLIK